MIDQARTPASLARTTLNSSWLRKRMGRFSARAGHGTHFPELRPDHDRRHCVGCAGLSGAWSSGPLRNLERHHRWALTFGSTLLSMVAGFSGSSTWKPVDIYGKMVLNLLAVIAFFLLLSYLRRYQLGGQPSAEDSYGR